MSMFNSPFNQFKNVSTESDVKKPYWGPCTATSALLKSMGGRPVVFGQHSVVSETGGNKFRGTLAMITGVGEVVQGLSQATNGFADWYVTLIYKGVAYRGYPVDTLDVDGEVIATANALSANSARAYFGDIGTMEFDLGNVYAPDETEFMYKICARQTSHTDGSLAGQFMMASAGNQGKDLMLASVPITDAQWVTWVANTASPIPNVVADFPTTNAAQDVGIRLHNLYAVTTKRTVASMGDSKRQGGQNESGLWLDHTDKPMFGEGSNMYGPYYVGVSNLGYAGEAVSNFGVTAFVGQKEKCFAGRAKLARMCTDVDYGYGYNSLTLSSNWQGETTCLAEYQAEFDWIKAQCPKIKRWFPSTITPSFTSTDFMTTLANSPPNRNPKILAIINGAIRKGLVKGMNGFSDPAAAVCAHPQTLAPKIPPRARVINTGTATITVAAATGSFPAITTMDVSGANTFTFEDEGAYFVIPGMGLSAGILRGQFQHVDGDTMRLIQRNSEDAPTAIRANQLNGSVTTLNINFVTNPMYVFAEHYFSDTPAAGGQYLHYGDRAYDEMRKYNASMGLINHR